MKRGFIGFALATVCGVATAVAAFDPVFKEQQKKKFIQEHSQTTSPSSFGDESTNAASSRDTATRP
jgi:hypothetical protein